MTTYSNFGSAKTLNELYEGALKQEYSIIYWYLLLMWTLFGTIGIIILALFEPFSDKLFTYALDANIPNSLIVFLGTPFVMLIRAILLVETVGYFYHRFFQHLSFMTRTTNTIRKNQRYHWIHHMIFYPVGKAYRRDGEYIAAEPGIGLSWVIPILIFAALILKFIGINIKSFLFIGFGLLYIYTISMAHERFHLKNHSWSNSKYFKWLEDIHILHHWDQGTNYTILNPVLDIIFGRYMSPKKHKKQIIQALKEYSLTISDVINWRYLLIEATPAEYAAFISAARQYPCGLSKVENLLRLLKMRVYTCPNDESAKDILEKAISCLKEIHTQMSYKILNNFRK